MKVTAKAHSNIALIKYWGKKDFSPLNIPAVGSISITLKELFTLSTVEFSASLQEDRLMLNGAPASEAELDRVRKFLDIIRSQANIQARAEVLSQNNFPTGAGLASSASAFASLALAGTKAAKLEYSMGQLSELARKGSGSAARSIFGGFAEMKTGQQEDGSDAIAYPLQDEKYWDICVIIAITSETQKKIGSTAGMNLTASTSPYYRDWVNSAPDDLKEMKKAIQEKNFPLLGELSEYSCLKMHGLAMSARPGLIYWNKTTLSCIQQIRELRESNVPVYFTIDAGPQVKALCLQKDKESVEQALQSIDGVHRTITTVLGPAVSIVEILD